MQSIQEIKNIISEKCAGKVMPQHTDAGHYYLHTEAGETYASVTTKCGILEAPHLKAWAAGLAIDYAREQVIGAGHNNASLDWDILKTAAILIHKDKFEDAGDVGTRGHHVVEEYLNVWMENDQKPADIRTFIHDGDPRVFAIARSAEMFCRDFSVIPVASELLVASAKHKYAGTLDSLMMVLNVTDKGDAGCLHDYMQLSRKNPWKVKCMHCSRKGEYEFSLVDWKSSNQITKPEYAMQTAAYWQALYEMTGLKPKRIYIIRLDKTKAKYEIMEVINRTEAFKAFVHTASVYEWLESDKPKLEQVGSRDKISLEELLQNNGHSNRDDLGLQKI